MHVGALRWWKLDPSEDTLRRRWKLKINFSGHDHRDAILYPNVEAQQSIIAESGSGSNVKAASGDGSVIAGGILVTYAHTCTHAHTHALSLALK